MHEDHPTPSTILLGVCGGIAAYKAVDVVSKLVKAGLDVHVQLTEAATRFVTPLTFSAMTGHPVTTTLFGGDQAMARSDAYPHLYPATGASAFLLIPATADVIAKVAHGLGSDLVTTSALSLPPTCKRYFAPAMNVEMWNQLVVQANCALLEQRGWIRLGPEAGALACGMEGPGRLADPDVIAATILRDVQPPTSWARLENRHILILSGPTHEYIDPVRFIGNASSGKMGRALAEAAATAGARVTMISGPVPRENLPQHPRVNLHHVVGAEDMLEAAQTFMPDADIILYAAAVADFRPAKPSPEKLTKPSAPSWRLDLVLNPDLAETLNRDKRPGQVAIGFALQTHDGVAKAKAKLVAKHLDAIVLNDETAIGADHAAYHWISADQVSDWQRLSKPDCATRILTAAADLLSA